MFVVIRFNADGSGKGMAGRANLVDFSGSTNSKAIDDSVDRSQPKKAVVKAPLGKQKFGVQADKTPFVTLFRNGDKFHKGMLGRPPCFCICPCAVAHVFVSVLLVCVGEKFKVKFSNFDQMKVAASGSVQLSTGAVQKFYKSGKRDCTTKLALVVPRFPIDGRLIMFCILSFWSLDCKTRVTKLESFVDGQSYLCCGGEKPAMDKLPPGLGYVPSGASAGGDDEAE